MPIVEAEKLYVKSLSNGRVHTKYRIEGNPALASREGCNLDQAEQTREISAEEVAATSPVLLCERDFQNGFFGAAAPNPDADDGTTEDVEAEG